MLAPVAPPTGLGEVWADGMADGNRHAYEIANELSAAEAYVTDITEQIEKDSRALLKILSNEGLLTPSDDQSLLFGQHILVSNGHKEGLRNLGWADGIAAIKNPEWGFKVKDVKQPVFIWHGADDKCVPLSHSEWYEANLPNAELTVERGKAHFGIADAWVSIAVRQRHNFIELQANAVTASQ